MSQITKFKLVQEINFLYLKIDQDQLSVANFFDKILYKEKVKKVLDKRIMINLK